MSNNSQVVNKTNNLIASIILDTLMPFQSNLGNVLAGMNDNQSTTLTDITVAQLNNFSIQEVALINTLLSDPNIGVATSSNTTIIFNFYSEYICFNSSLENLNLCGGILSPLVNISSGPYAVFNYGNLFTNTEGTLTKHTYTDSDITSTVYTILSEVNESLNKTIAKYQLLLITNN